MTFELIARRLINSATDVREKLVVGLVFLEFVFFVLHMTQTGGFVGA